MCRDRRGIWSRKESKLVSYVVEPEKRVPLALYRALIPGKLGGLTAASRSDVPL
jgi:hypothetical protein